MTRFAFAGDRQIAVDCLDFLLGQGDEPEALLVSSPQRATHAEVLMEKSGLPSDRVLAGREFREPEGIEMLRSLDLDYVIGVHFPYIVPEEILELPRIGVVNLHPAYLPYNRGWHTPSWAILEETPIGATVHFMDSGLDTGDIVTQERLEVRPEDTAHTLYQRILALELQLFRESWPLLASGDPPRRPQPATGGSRHDRAELGLTSLRRLDLTAHAPVVEVMRTLRALTTDDPDESAFFEVEGRRYLIQVTITPEDASPA